jgi:DNA-binding NtrC family response regulator
VTILQMDGANVALARGVQQAKALLDARRVDVLIGDLGLADADGAALLHQVRAQKRGLSVRASTRFSSSR